MGSGVAAAISIPITTMHFRRFTLNSYSPLFSFLSLYHTTPNPTTTLSIPLFHHPIIFSLPFSPLRRCSFSTAATLHSGEPLIQIKLETFGRSLRLLISKINDGSSLSNMQCVIDSETEGYDQVESGLITTGASISVQGVIVESKGSKQKVELKVNKIILVGKSNPSFPIQKKRVSREFLRTKAHLRARTNTFGADFFWKTGILDCLRPTQR